MSTLSSRKGVRVTEKECIKIGFEKLPYFTIGGNLVYDLGRNRHLSINGIYAPNEALYICECNTSDYRDINDIICLHNYNTDGDLTKSKLLNIIRCLKHDRK